VQVVKERDLIRFYRKLDIDAEAAKKKERKEEATKDSQQLREVMDEVFLSPSAWSGRAGLLSKPLSAFGSAFSHRSISHLLSNWHAYKSVSDTLERRLGSARFSHLYLVSIIAQQVMVCIWQEFAPLDLLPQGRAGIQHLGASGAVSGLLAFDLFTAPAGTMYELPGGRQVPPIVYCAIHFGTDVGGLLRSQTMMKVFKRVLDGKKVNVEEEENMNIGFAAHLGGAFGGAVMALYWRRRGVIR